MAMPLVPREGGFPTHSAETGSHTPHSARHEHMIITARGAGFGPEPLQGPRGVAPCPGCSAAHCWGHGNPRYRGSVGSTKTPIRDTRRDTRTRAFPYPGTRSPGSRVRAGYVRCRAPVRPEWEGQIVTNARTGRRGAGGSWLVVVGGARDAGVAPWPSLLWRPPTAG